MGRPPSKAERGSQQRRTHNSAVAATGAFLTPSQKREQEKEAKRHAARTKGYHDAEKEKRERLAAERLAAERLVAAQSRSGASGGEGGLVERRMEQEKLARRAAAAGVSPQLLALKKKELQRLTKCSARALRNEARDLAIDETLISNAIGTL